MNISYKIKKSVPQVANFVNLMHIRYSSKTDKNILHFIFYLLQWVFRHCLGCLFDTYHHNDIPQWISIPYSSCACWIFYINIKGYNVWVPDLVFLIQANWYKNLSLSHVLWQVNDFFLFKQVMITTFIE